MTKAALASILCAGALLAVAVAAEAQQPKKMPVIGYLDYGSAIDKDEAFFQALRDLGWIDGQNIAIEHRWAEGKLDRLPAMAKELVGINVHVIVARTATVIRAAKQATTTIPIIMTRAADAHGFIKKAGRAGVDRVFIGLENINPESLKEARKGQNRITEYRAMLQAWHRVGTLTYAGYIIGFPGDTPATIERDIRIIQRELPVDLLEFFILTPLPGSEDHKALHGRRADGAGFKSLRRRGIARAEQGRSRKARRSLRPSQDHVEGDRSVSWRHGRKHCPTVADESGAEELEIIALRYGELP